MIIDDISLSPLDWDLPAHRYYLSNIFGQFPGPPSGEHFQYSSENKNTELIVAGCSFTYGDGVNYSDSWGYLLGTMLDVNYVNISGRGWSMQDVLNGIFHHIREHGNPKYIALLSTELIRGRDVVDGSNTTLRGRPEIKDKDVTTTSKHSSLAPDGVVRYSKIPHHVEDISHPDMYVYRSIAALNALLLYCKAAGIAMVWGTWDEKSSNLYKFIQSEPELAHIDLGSYVQLLPYYFGDKAETAMKDHCSLNKHSMLENIGNDSGKHAGNHYHIHWANDLYNKLIHEIGK